MRENRSNNVFIGQDGLMRQCPDHQHAPMGNIGRGLDEHKHQ